MKNFLLFLNRGINDRKYIGVNTKFLKIILPYKKNWAFRRTKKKWNLYAK